MRTPDAGDDEQPAQEGVRNVRKIRIIVLYSFAGLALFVLLAGAFTQTQLFRDRLRAFALTQLASALNADVRMGEIRGNIVTGFSIDTVGIDVEGRPLLRLAQLDLSYNLLAIPGKSLSIRSLTLVHPEILLSRPAGGEWNISRMVRPHPAASGEFDWVITLARLEIREGTITVLDSAAMTEAGHTPPDGRTVEYHSFTLRHVNAVLHADISSAEKRVAIDSCSFAADRPDIRIRQLSGLFRLTPVEVRADSVRIVTARSRLALDAAMRGVDLLRGIDLHELQNAPVTLSFHAYPVDMDELKEFLPATDFLTGKVTTDLRADGEFGDLNVRQLDLGFGSSSLFLRGGLYNLHDPGKLMLNVKITESTIVPADVPALMPPFGIPDMTPIGNATLNLEFEGSPVDFKTKFLLETPAGRLQSSGFALAVGGPSSLKYDGTILFDNLNLARVLDDNRMKSALNGTVRVQGKGVRMHQLSSGFSLQIDTSAFRGIPVERTRVTVTADRRKLVAEGIIDLGEMRAALHGTLDEPEGVEPAFSIEADVASLNLEHILRDSSYNSDITLKLRAEGTGETWNTVNGSATADLSSSRFRDYEVTQGDFHLSIDQRDSLNKSLQFTSNIADLTINGAFDLPYLAALLPFELGNLREALGEKIAAIDSTLLAGVDRVRLASRARTLDERRAALDAQYIVRVKDLEPLSAAAGEKTFNGAGLLSGTIRGGYENVSLSCELSVDNFFYGTADAGILVENGSASLDVQSLAPLRPLSKLAMRLQTRAGKFLVNRDALDSLDLSVDYRNESALFEGSALINGAYRLHAGGDARVGENSITVGIRTLEAAYQNFAWRADPGAVFRVNHVGAGVEGLVMRRDMQTVEVQAAIGQGKSITATIDGSHLDLDDLKYLLADEELGPMGQAFAGGGAFHATADGTPGNPVYTVTVTGENISFRTLPFGRLSGAFRYENRLLMSHVRVNAMGEPPDAPPVMTVEGALPLDLTLEPAADRIPDQPLNLRITSRGIQMNVLDPLLPTFNQLSGLMSCDLTLAGTLRHPTYDGSIGITECGFLFVPNNITYTLNGTFNPSGDRIRVADCVIRNLPEDERSGRQGEVHVSGDFALRDLKPGDFNLNAAGQLLVVKETTRKSSLEVYGDLFVEIGPGPLRFTGEVDNSLLKGSLLIRNSSLVFPPTEAVVAEESAQSVPVSTVDDTVHTVPGRDQSVVSRYLGTGLNPATGAAATELKRSRSFIDGLQYDLDIETGGGNTEIRMIFNPATSEELVASLDGKFTIAEDGTRWTGELNIDRAYYNFFKRFDATGTIRFTGDLMNPELNIVAKYKGTRTVPDSSQVGEKRQEAVVVTVKITGTRYVPKVEFSMTIDELDYYSYPLSRGPKSNDVQSDAIQFIVAGTFPLTTSQKTDLASEFGGTAGFSLLTGATSLLTGRLSDFLRAQTGFISSVELSYGGKESTELRLSGTAWNGYWRYGGTILNGPFSVANISILYSFGTIFNNPSLRNLMFELEHRVEPGTLGESSDLKRIYSARLYYRFSF